MSGLFILSSKQVWKVPVCLGAAAVCVLADEEHLNPKGHAALEKHPQ
jgi:hypothetical protein